MREIDCFWVDLVDRLGVRGRVFTSLCPPPSLTRPPTLQSPKNQPPHSRRPQRRHIRWWRRRQRCHGGGPCHHNYRSSSGGTGRRRESGGAAGLLSGGRGGGGRGRCGGCGCYGYGIVMISWCAVRFVCFERESDSIGLFGGIQALPSHPSCTQFTDRPTAQNTHTPQHTQHNRRRRRRKPLPLPLRRPRCPPFPNSSNSSRQRQRRPRQWRPPTTSGRGSRWDWVG